MLSVIERNQIVTEQQILQPVPSVLEEITPRPTITKPIAVSPSSEKSIHDLFPEQEYEDKAIQRAKEILGKTASNFSKEEVRDLVAQVEYLVETWLDDFERDIFKGRTLNELLHERDGL